MTEPALPSTAPASTGRLTRSRIAGVDLARAVAILGMFAVHIGPNDGQGLAGRVYAAPHGRASILFALVAGVGVTLLARSRSQSGAQARLRLLWRAVVLLPLGLVLQHLDPPVFVILQNYAVLFVLAIAVLSLGDRWLLGLAAASALLGPVGYVWGRIAAPEAFEREAVSLTDPAAEIAHGLVLSGPYPLITWAAPFLVGMWLGRRDLRSAAVRVRLLWVGAAVAVAALVTSLLGDSSGPVGWDELAVGSPHSQMPLWVVGATGSAAFVLGVALFVTDVAGRLAWPLVATGQLALTVYVGHVLALAAAPDALTTDGVAAAVRLVGAFTLVAMVVATAWRALFARGPLEAVLAAGWRRS
jgi:uncharacterized membrane protein YeiB